MRLSALACVCCACAATPRDAVNEVHAADLPLPGNARAGSFVTWELAGSAGEPVRETWACVARGGDGTVVERRQEFVDGAVVVVAVRYGADGAVRGAWRGPAGGAGTPVRVVGSSAERQREVLARAADVQRDAELPPPAAESSRRRETVVTPAGRFECVRTDHEARLLWMRTRVTSWHALEPLPFSQLVKFEDAGPGDRLRARTLVAYGWTGATAMLRMPSAFAAAPLRRD